MGLKLLIKKVKGYNKNADFALIEKAYNFSSELHKGQKRKSGEDYIVHPLNTALILAGLKLDEQAICAGLLHDVLEDTSCNFNKLKNEFGREVADIVDGVSKIKLLKKKSMEQYNTESIKKMLLATSKDIRVILVKLADKLHNMRTLDYLEEPIRKKIAQETLDVYAPLAYRLGLADIKWELEDLAFRELYPGLFEEFNSKIIKSRKQRENDVDKLEKELNDALKKHKVKALEISGRAKNFYSIYRKMQKRSKKFEEIYDLVGLRIITKDIKDCYEALGVIHGLWKPLPGKFKDYIARPKENLYRSLHTLVVANGLMVEIQIRTKEMDDIANEGIAAHWRYKGLKEDERFDRKISWVKQILDLKYEDGSNFMKNLMIDVFGDRIYVFTPKGDVIELPKGSTPVDFAYAVHSDLGNKCVGVRVNDKFVNLRRVLNSGDVVEIIISKNRLMPSRDWLKFVKSSRAVEKIKHALAIIQKIPAGRVKEKSDEAGDKKSLVNTGLKYQTINFGKCCNPLPGDELIGLVSKSNRVMVHKKDCRGILLKKETYKPRIKVSWKESIDCNITIKVLAYDRIGLFADILNTIAFTGKKISNARAYTYGKEDSVCEFTLNFEKMDELKEIIDRIKRIADVKSVQLIV